MRRYLCLCGGGEFRSKTAAAVLREIARERGIDIFVDSGAVDFLVKPVSAETARYYEQFDKVIVMKPYMAEKAHRFLGIDSSRMRCIDVPDDYRTEEKLAEPRVLLRPKLRDIID